MKTVILKAGSTYSHTKKNHGDFEDWIIQGMEVQKNDVLIINPEKNDPFPLLDEINGVIITGTHLMVTDEFEWKQPSLDWVRKVVKQRIPCLGICFGHQLLAYAMGGVVNDNPNGVEAGTVSITYLQAAKSDRLFRNLHFKKINVSHWQSVLQLPKGAVHLASSDLEKHQAFCIDNIAWGIQFHPEFNGAVTIDYLEAKKDHYEKQGWDLNAAKQKCQDTDIGPAILKRFFEIIKEH